MPIEIVFEEDRDSRKLSFTQENVEQTITGQICGDFFSEATENSAGLWTDDIVVLEHLYPRIPLYITIPVYSGLTAILTLTNLDIEQVNDRVWKFELKYGIPNNGGRSGGGLGTTDIGEVGPDPIRQYSQNFTQVSFNVSVDTRTRDFSLRTEACQKNVAVGGNVPYPQGESAPIGHTIDGIKGAEVYERQFAFQITSYFEPSKLDYSYVRMLHNLATTINNAPFFGFPTGTVLFTGASASGDLYQVIPVTFEFKVRNNFKFVQNGQSQLANPFETDPTQIYDIRYEPYFPDSGILSGWSVVDYAYRAKADTTAKMVIQEPYLRTVHEVYHYADFSRFDL